MYWFTANAPIRLKLLIAFGTMIGLTALAPLAALIFGREAAIILGTLAVLSALILAIWFRAAIARPYVRTVVRMEALAAGDLESPIAHTDFRDCVGRMTKAMFAFRDRARAEIGLNAEAERNADIVRGMTANLTRLAQGDLTAEIVDAYPPSYAQLRSSFNSALTGLRELIGAVGDGATTIDTGAQEIARASHDLARRTEANAASLEETAAALGQMDERLKLVADAAGQTVVRADAAIGAVRSGRKVADRAVTAMGRVGESAKGIDAVIEGLDKIAFQTRVLAMNAAVEAGRAGEAGRGFAVVADLVSALAMRSEEEARRAREGLSATQGDIAAAVEAVTHVDAALGTIVADVGEVHRLLNGMADDNRAQSTAIGQISSAIGTMDQVLQQNAAMVEQCSAAAANLSQEVGALRVRTGGFTIDEPGTFAETWRLSA